MSDFEPAHHQKIGGASARATAILAGGFRGVSVLGGTLFLLALDLMLSVSLMISQSAGQQLPDAPWDRFMFSVFGTGSDLSLWGKIIPWLFSVGTTGLIYALWNPPPGVQRTWVTWVGWAMALMDTATDVGGLNAFMTGDPQAGTQIFPEGMPSIYLFFDFVAAVACLGQEPLLKVLLGQQKARANMPTADPGAPIERGLLNISGGAYSLTSAASMIVGSLGLLLLDVVLTPQYPAPNELTKYFFWGFSFFIFFLQLAAWRRFRRMHDANQKLSEQTARVKMIAFGIAVTATIDTIFDLKGYNASLYHTSALFIENRTPVWWLTACMLTILTLFGEPMNDKLFGELYRNFGPGGGGGGGPAITIQQPPSPQPPPAMGGGGGLLGGGGAMPGGFGGLGGLPKPPIPPSSPPGGGSTPPGTPPAPWLPGS